MDKNTLVSADKLTAEIASIAKCGQLWVRSVQACAVQAIGYSILHGDIRFGQQLLEAMPKSTRKQTLVAYLEKFGYFVFQSESKKLVYYKGKDKAKEYNPKALMASSWEAAAPEPAIVSTVDVASMVDKLIKRIESQIKQCNNVKDGELFDNLRNTVAAYHLKNTKLLNEASFSEVFPQAA